QRVRKLVASARVYRRERDHADRPELRSAEVLIMRAARLVATSLVAFAACASTMEVERREYILSRPHGWIELSIADDGIPMVPAWEEDRKGLLIRPLYCGVEARLDREPYASIYVFPTGDQAPFAVRSGVRFPAPIGPALLSVSYSGCDAESGKVTSTSAQLYI